MTRVRRSFLARLILTYVLVVLVVVAGVGLVTYQFTSTHLPETARLIIASPGGGQHELANLVLRSLVGASIVGLLIGVALAVGFARTVARPLQEMVHASHRLAAGHYAERVTVPKVSDLAELAVAFNAMAGELEKTERLRRDLIANVAHELRTPLSCLQGNLEALRDGVFEPDPTLLADLHGEALRLGVVLDELQNLAMAEAGLAIHDLTAVDLADLVARVVRLLRAEFVRKGVTLHEKFPDALSPVQADAARLEQVITNLLTNALKFTPDGGQVSISANQWGDGTVELVIADTGIGLPSEELNRIFDRFYRAASARRSSPAGAGLGLAIARAIVEAHGGRIWAESKGPGRGSTFHVALPERIAPDA